MEDLLEGQMDIYEYLQGEKSEQVKPAEQWTGNMQRCDCGREPRFCWHGVGIPFSLNPERYSDYKYSVYCPACNIESVNEKGLLECTDKETAVKHWNEGHRKKRLWIIKNHDPEYRGTK